MAPSEKILSNQLKEYRKAIRAMMYLYMQSRLLYDLINGALDPNECLDSWEDLDINNFSKNEYLTITDDAWDHVLGGCDWQILGYNNNYKIKEGSVLISLACFFDYYPAKRAEASTSVIEIEGWHITSGPSRAITEWDDTDYRNAEAKNAIIPEHKFTTLAEYAKGYKSIERRGVVGDYAYGKYDIATLTNPPKVRDEILKPTNKLLDKWCG